MSDLQPLIDRLREATGADRALDAAITVALTEVPQEPEDLKYLNLPHKGDHCTPGTYWFHQRSGFSLRTSEPLTASVDAALALVELKLPCCLVHLSGNFDGGWIANLKWVDVTGHHDTAAEFEIVADTLPLAICSTLLLALQAKEERDNG